MPIVILSCLCLVTLTGCIHFEALRALHRRLPALGMPDRFKLLVVLGAGFAIHAAEILLYGIAFYGLVTLANAGRFAGASGALLSTCFYFSAETYTSLGLGDVAPAGAIRLLAGVEALNGLLLIGWTASFTYLAMERFWAANESTRSCRGGQDEEDRPLR